MTIEDILCETGGFGQFQLFVLLGVGLNRFTIGWSMLQMSYAGSVPEWTCLDHNTTDRQNVSINDCYTNSNNHIHNGEVCDKFHFVGSVVTIISEWNLVCSLSWVKATVTSIQMGGVLLGALVAGQMGDSLGRKKTMYVFVLEHAVLNFIAAFSVTWQMFAVCRFFIGLGIGGVLVSSFPYSMEFLPLRWRPLVSVLPIWSVGVCVFALASWLTMNWSYLHITCGALSLTGLLGYIYVPESLRWLTVHDRMEDARDVVMKIAVINHKIQPRKASVSLQAVAWEEQKAHDSNKRYTYIDIFREWTTARTSFIFCFHWFSLAIVYYGLSFSVAYLAGSVNLNIFLLAVVEIPAILSTFYFDNRIGRKWTTIISLAIACVPIFACLIVHIHSPEGHKTAVITSLCLIAKMGLGAAWAVGETWCAEFYPTVTRCLGFGTVHVTASIGALITPFVINLNDAAIVSFTVMGCLLLVDIAFCVFFAPETKDLELADTPTNIRAAKKLTGDKQAASKKNDSVDNRGNHADNKDTFEDVLSQKIEKAILGNVEEDISDNETDEKNTVIVIEKETELDDVGWRISHYSPKIKRDKIKMTEMRHDESQAEGDVSTPSPVSSLAASPKTKRFQKLESKEFVHGKTSNESPKIKREKAHMAEMRVAGENQTENCLSTPTPGSSPAPSPKLKRLDKTKSDEFFDGKTSSESPKGKRNKVHIADIRESQTEKGLSTPSPSSSPAPSPKIKRLDKIISGEFFHVKTSNESPKLKRDKRVHMADIRESQTENGLSTPSPSSSPAPSPKIKRLNKIMSGEFFHGKTSNETSKKKSDKMNAAEMRESQTEKGLSTPSPGTSPTPSPKLKRLDKTKSGEFSHGKTSSESPKVKRNKAHMADIRESQTEKGLSTPSPSSSPAPSPKIKRLDKIKSGEFFHGKSKSKPVDDSPPYIESSHNKNVRFSIY